jgi:hypothetical protein
MLCRVSCEALVVSCSLMQKVMFMELVESVRNIGSIDFSSKTCCIVSNDTDMCHC